MSEETTTPTTETPAAQVRPAAPHLEGGDPDDYVEGGHLNPAEDGETFDDVFDKEMGEQPPATQEQPPATQEQPPATQEQPPATQQPPATPPATQEPADPLTRAFVPPTPKPVEQQPAPDGQPVPDDKPDPLDVAEPAGVSPKAAESFRQLKQASQQERDRLQQELEEVRAQAAKVGEVPEDVKSELETLRAFRRQFALERDPEFQSQFTSKAQAVEDKIYETLKKELGVTDEAVEKIKGYGGWMKVQQDKILAKAPANVRLAIEARTRDLLSLEDQRQDALAKAAEEAKTRPLSADVPAKLDLSTHDEAKAFVTSALDEVAKVQPAFTGEIRTKLESEITQILKEVTPARIADLALSARAAQNLSAQNVSLSQQLEAEKQARAKAEADLAALRQRRGVPRPAGGGVAPAGGSAEPITPTNAKSASEVLDSELDTFLAERDKA